MNPALYVELLQTRRAIAKLLLICLCVPFGMRFILGDIGVLIGTSLVLPHITSALGMGTFLEELGRGQMRFLFALPLRRSTLFAVKLLNGLAWSVIAAAAVLAGIGAAHLIRPISLEPLGLALNIVGIDPGAALLVSAAYSAYSFCGGLFSILFCRQVKQAQLLNVLFSYGPLIVLLTLSPSLVDRPPLHGWATTFLLTAIILGLGAWRLYLRRNPFDESVSLLRNGLLYAAAAGLIFIGGIAAMGRVSPDRRGLDPGHVMAFQASPDGKRVLVVTVGMGTEGYLLDDEGRILQELGPGILPVGINPQAAWSPDGRWLHVQRLRVSFSLDTALKGPRGSAGHPGGLLIDVKDGPPHVLALPDGDPAHIGFPVGWTVDGRLLLYRMGYGAADSPRAKLYLQSGAGGRLEEIELATRVKGIPNLSGGNILIYEVPGEGERRELAFFDLTARREERLSLDDSVVEWSAAPEPGKILMVRGDVDGDRLAYRVVVHDRAGGGQRTLLGKPDLPSIAVARAANQLADAVSLVPFVGTPWFRCESRTSGGISRAWLIDVRSERVVPLAGNAILEKHLSMASSIVTANGKTLAMTLERADGEDYRLAVTTRVHEIGEEGIRLVAEHAIDGDSVAWLGSSRLLYLKRSSKLIALGGGELWVIELASGERRRFFEGRRADSSVRPPGP